MIQILRFLLFTCFCYTSALSQSFYFKTGKNFTSYVFESSSAGIQSSVVKLQPDTGSFYELGASLPFGSSRFSYEFGFSLNELNSIVETPSKAVKYKTEYVGLDNSVVFSVLKNKFFSWDAKLGFCIQTLIFGKQEIGGALYDLKRFKEFNGLFFRQSLGTQIKLVANNQLNFSVGYDYHYDVFNSNNSSTQSLKIYNNQIKFGIYYLLDKKNKGIKIISIQNKDSLKSVINPNTKLLTKGDKNINEILPLSVADKDNIKSNSTGRIIKSSISEPLSNTNNSQSENSVSRINQNGLSMPLSNAINNKIQYNVISNRLSRNSIVPQKILNLNTSDNIQSDHSINKVNRNNIPIQNTLNEINRINLNLADKKSESKNADTNIDKQQSISNEDSLNNSIQDDALSPSEFVKKGKKIPNYSLGNGQSSVNYSNNNIKENKSNLRVSNQNFERTKNSNNLKMNSIDFKNDKKKTNLNEISKRLKRVENKINSIEKKYEIK